MTFFTRFKKSSGTSGTGKRFNQGKTRYDLVPAFAQEQYAQVLTKGAEKYGDSNWRKGMRWSIILASLERHLAAIKKGEDYDEETGLYHSAHIMCNAGFLTEYYKIHPQGDDRIVQSLHIGVVMNGFEPEQKLPFTPHVYLNVNMLDDYGSDLFSFYHPKAQLNPKARHGVISNMEDLLFLDDLEVMVTVDLAIFMQLRRMNSWCVYLLETPETKSVISLEHHKITSLYDLV